MGIQIFADTASEHGYDTLSDYDLHERYDDYLDEVFGDVDVAGLSYPTSRLLKDVDDVAYRCGYSDWLYSECQNGNIRELDDGEYMEESKYNDLLDELQVEIDAKEGEE